ncbi:fungal-specific transcription factor domain-containing protein [Exophiala viscosa]|uniref:fungal-specific transcription factor domain-containing protein n=1 Tax=Exophiala viscosa TaxID=2486360 RepID=UPI00219E6D51|nr:fungal-specific transcription factor domain-containing protein [Exophiala viscosa]
MPRPKKSEEDGREVKKRSRNGCWPCKSRKVKCGEEKPSCINCQRQGETCDYSIRLNWDGRSKKKDDGKPGSQIISFASPQHMPPSLPNGYSNGSSNHSPIEELTPQPSHVQPQMTANFTVNQHPESALPPIADFANNLQVPPTEFNPALLPPPPILRTPQWNENVANNNIPEPAVMPHLRHSTSFPAYPSPSDSGFGSPNLNNGMYQFNGHSTQMPPPMPTSNPLMYQESLNSPYNSAKRMRLSPRTDSFGRPTSHFQRASSYGPNDHEEHARVQFNPNTPTFFPTHLQNPLTPATSATSQVSQDNDDRRISVSSLLSEDPDTDDAKPVDNYQHTHFTQEEIPRRGSLHQRMVSYTATETYGQDRGNPDLDIPRNNDTMAISGMSPSEHSDFENWLHDTDLGVPEFGFGLVSRETVFGKGGYYASPVPIKIPRKLEPLPRALSENPMNLLYFHHFLNHTARILVPHDCPENPFKTILPKMAVENANLLNLLLAYSASHRARLLNHPEPANRIALWVRDVFPSLRQTLDNVSNTEVSNANLATAIMLASLEIISPSSFGVSIPWQNHLSIARSIIRARGGPNSISRKDPVMYFLTRWLAYLDVMGSLSGRRNEEPLFAGNYWSSSHDESTSAKELSLTDEDDTDDEDDYTIDCLLGFTTRCVSILAQVALLARQCESNRIDATGRINEAWKPSPDILKKAEKLRKDLEHARNHEQISCSHPSPTLTKAHLVGSRRNSAYIEMTDKDVEESLATNSVFHWAGLIHLLRRIHNLPRSDPQVQAAVHEIVKVLQSLRAGGSAEACLLFPMFTAGVEAEDSLDRAEVLSRIKGVEGLGMCQVSRARKIMEEVWRTGDSWENLVTGEFFG